MMVLVSGCSSSSDWSDQDISNAASVWINQLGLTQTDEEVWSDRLDAVCADGADNFSLAEQYVAEDAGYSVRSDGTVPALGKAGSPLTLFSFRLASVS